MEFHVLSNDTFIGILTYGLMSLVLLLPLFNYWGSRNPAPGYKKGIIAKIVPWVLLCIFISEVCLLFVMLSDYPWSIPAEPSSASINRELEYVPSDNPLFGWANDKQNLILRNYTGSILWLCWTVYAFSFRKSLTSWWKKACKVVAYLIFSALILGFSIHELRDSLVYAAIAGIAFLLLWIARVKPVKEQTLAPVNTQEESNKEEMKKVNTEDPSRFMPSEQKSVPTVEVAKPVVTTQIDQQPLQDNDLPISDNSSAIDNAENAGSDITIASITTPQETLSEDAAKEDTDAPLTVRDQSETKYCKYCGKQIEADSTYCKYCGRKLQ